MEPVGMRPCDVESESTRVGAQLGLGSNSIPSPCDLECSGKFLMDCALTFTSIKWEEY